MLSALLGLLGAAVYGASDFLGGLAARQISAVKVTAINAVAGLALLLLGSIFVPSQWSIPALVTGLVGGLAGAACLVLLYACLAIGPMSILAPIIALISAAIPIAVGFFRGERLSAAGNLGLLVGAIAIVLICLVPGEGRVRPSVTAVLMACGSGISVGLYLVIIDLSPSDSGGAPLLVTFAVTAVVMGAILFGQRIARRGLKPPRATRQTIVFAVLCGLTDAVAASLFLIALRVGDLSVVSVLSALAPAGTIVLAALFLKERIAKVQWAGLAIALVAAALLALA
jgi:drug/metabolite transporter (DMT)-like permease